MSFPPTQRPMWAPVPPRTSGVQILEVVGIALGGVGALALIKYLADLAGFQTVAISALLALVPLTIIAVGILWIDRWEPEPRLLLLTAFLWGAGVSTALSYILNTALGSWVATTAPPGQVELLSASVVAPIVEETLKCLGILIIYLMRPRAFDGPVDGIVYAAVIAGGFAFTENILYFSEYRHMIGEIFFLRGIQSPWAHVTFTMMCGIAIGLAAQRRKALSLFPFFVVGLIMAMLLHSLWNYSAFGGTFVSLYFVLQVPIFLVLIGVVYYLRLRESKMIEARLAEFSKAGWLSRYEVHMLGSFRERARARAWAAAGGKRATMVVLQRTATRLAYDRERALLGRGHRLDYVEQDRLLRQLTAAREEIFGTAVVA